jgi:hypothetical protein
MGVAERGGVALSCQFFWRRSGDFMDKVVGVGARMRKVLTNRGVTMEGAAKRLGMSKQAVSYALGKRGAWRESDVEFWYSRLGIDKAKVVGGDDGSEV